MGDNDVRKFLAWPGSAHRKMIMTSRGTEIVFTSWRDDSELAMVRDWLFPHHSKPDPYSPPPGDMREDAVDMINVWRHKDHGLPHAISSTCSLTDAILHDRRELDRFRFISTEALQSIYAMAFCRFVNGFVDRDVAKSSLTALAVDANEGGTTVTPASRGESSMYAHASRIGLPQRFVDLRHQATHDRMPRLGEWREAVDDALEWLYERWWKTNATGNPARAWREWRSMDEQNELGPLAAGNDGSIMQDPSTASQE